MTQPPDPSFYIKQIQEGVRAYIDPPAPPSPPADRFGGEGDDSMEQRLRAIEDRLLTFETKSDTFATRDDVRAVEATVSRIETSVHKELHAQTWKLLSFATGLIAVAFFIGRFVLPPAEPPRVVQGSVAHP